MAQQLERGNLISSLVEHLCVRLHNVPSATLPHTLHCLLGALQIGLHLVVLLISLCETCVWVRILTSLGGWGNRNLSCLCGVYHFGEEHVFHAHDCYIHQDHYRIMFLEVQICNCNLNLKSITPRLMFLYFCNKWTLLPVKATGICVCNFC